MGARAISPKQLQAMASWLERHGVPSDRALATDVATRLATDLALPLEQVLAASELLIAAACARHEQAGAAFARVLEQTRSTPVSTRRSGVLSQLAARAGDDEKPLLQALATALSAGRAEIGEALQATPARDVAGVQALCRRWSDQVDALVTTLGQRVAQELGAAPPGADGKPLGLSLFAVGSFGRQELSFYSDIDYGIVIEQDSPAMRAYVQRFAERLGQLLHRIEGEGGMHPCPDLSPGGLLGAALVGTPEQLAQRLVARSDDMSRRTLRDQVCIQSALSAARPLGSDEASSALFTRFADRAQQELGAQPPNMRSDGGRRAALQRVGMGLRDPFGVPDEIAHWNEVPGDGVDSGTAARARASTFVPLSPEQALARGQVNLKHDLLRALQIPLQALHLLFGTRAAAGDEVLAELDARGLVDHAFAGKLRECLSTCLRYRMLNDWKAGRSEPRLLEVTDRDRRTIRRLVPLLYRLRQGMEQLGTGDPNTFTLS